ncbi:TetR/AcrR family transcriptional regulator [Actinomadura rayongensis]|nr:TetR/AcrR family transcriptional regulator [Actinomadura rayongensis]
MTGQKRPPGRPPRISRDEIVAAAHRIVAEEGVEKLTMRRLAREVGSTPMALYHHVSDRDGLLLLLLEDYAVRAPRPDLPADPRERVIAVATAMRDALAEIPWIMDVLTSGRLFGRSALWFNEQIIAAALDCGLTPEDAVRAYRAIWHYTAGQIIVTSRERAARDRARAATGTTYRERVFGTLDPDEHPALARVADRWEELSVRDDYAAGLRALVDGLVRRA